MAIKYSKLFVAEKPVSREPVTVLVEYIEAERFQGVSVERLDGEYNSTEDFGKAVNHFFDVLKKGLDAARPYMNLHAKEDDAKLYTSLLLSTHDARRLADSLIAALEASEES